MSEKCHFKILSCGSNGSGQLGLNHQEDILEISTENAIEFISKPIKISCGGNHTLILCEDGNVYAAGDISHDVLLNISDTASSFSGFKQISFNGISKFKNITCGWEFSTLITLDNCIYSFGVGLNGELGLGKDKQRTNAAIKIETVFGDNAITDIKSSIHSIIIQLSNGELWGWGNNKKGQLLPLHGDKSLKIIWEPKKLPFTLNEVHDFAMAREFTIFRTSKLIIMGADKFGIEQEMSNKNINSKEIIQLMAMWSSVHIQMAGQAYLTSLGNNSHGQRFPIPNSGFRLFTVGSEHGLCYDEYNNTVYAWGWGEHGNCGLQKGKASIDNVTFDFLNPIYKLLKSNGNEKIVSLFGGCATSWIVVSITG